MDTEDMKLFVYSIEERDNYNGTQGRVSTTITAYSALC